jgi:hypothetical protein
MAKSRTWRSEKTAKRAYRFTAGLDLEMGVLQDWKNPREKMMNSIGLDLKVSCQGQGPFSGIH